MEFRLERARHHVLEPIGREQVVTSSVSSTYSELRCSDLAFAKQAVDRRVGIAAQMSY